VEKMNVLSLFDGISCGKVALDRAGIKVDKYYASEIDKYAIEISKKKHTNIIKLVNATEIDIDKLPKIDLLLAGFPCQSWSRAGSKTGGKSKNGGLLYVMMEIYHKLKEKNEDILFLFENVVPQQKFLFHINEVIGVAPLSIDSMLLSPQRRSRLYWTNIPDVVIPQDNGVSFKDIIDHDIYLPRIEVKERHFKIFRYSQGDKSPCLTASCYKGGGNTGMPLIMETLCEYNVDTQEMLLFLENNNDVEYMYIPKLDKYYIYGNKCTLPCGVEIDEERLLLELGDGVLRKGFMRMLTPYECEKLQTLPVGYTEGVSTWHRYKSIGNGWTVNVIVHILKHIR
jgi:DNA (cytosine-5)-methyltransferase 3A